MQGKSLSQTLKGETVLESPFNFIAFLACPGVGSDLLGVLPSMRGSLTGLDFSGTRQGLILPLSESFHLSCRKRKRARLLFPLLSQVELFSPPDLLIIEFLLLLVCSFLLGGRHFFLLSSCQKCLEATGLHCEFCRQIARRGKALRPPRSASRRPDLISERIATRRRKM